MKQSTSHDELQSLLGDHDELAQRIDAIRQWWEELDEFGRPKFGEMADRVAEFRAALATHFDDEECGGYLRPVLDAAPGFADAAEALRKQHPALLSDAAELVDHLHKCDRPGECWKDARKRFESLVDAVRRHETAENLLIRRAMNEPASRSTTPESGKPR